MMFSAPLVLAGLALLPLILLLLRLNPPSPRRIRFPPIALLQNLAVLETTPHRLPLWLLLLRGAALFCLILGLAGPVLRPPPLLPGSGPILLVIDNGWAAAAAWPDFMARAGAILDAAQAQHRGIALLATARDAAGQPPRIQGIFTPSAARGLLSAMIPAPWPTDRAGDAQALARVRESTRIYLADATGGPGFDDFLRKLHPSRIYAPPAPAPLLGPLALDARGTLTLHADARAPGSSLLALSARFGILARLPFDASNNATLNLPHALENQIARFTLDGPPTAGGTVLTDASSHFITVALVSESGGAEAPFTGGLYFLRRALPPGTEVLTGTFEAALAAKPNLLILDDLPLGPAQRGAAYAYLQGGGTLLRFAGPLTAAAPDPLTPDPLLAGARHLGGALTWARPEKLGPLPPGTPLSDLKGDPSLTVGQEIIADPATLDPATVWARLEDGTPFILGSTSGPGRLITILTTANTAWSNFALSGLYPVMLARIAALAQGSAPAGALELDLTASLDAFGKLQKPAVKIQLTPRQWRQAFASPQAPPGLYTAGGRIFARNLAAHLGPASKMSLPNAAPLNGSTPARRLGPFLLLLAFLLLALDFWLSLLLRGLLPFRRLALFLLLVLPLQAQAEAAALQTTLGYLPSGDATLDQLTQDGLTQLSADVSTHTSVQLAPPAALDPARDDLAYYPLIYWPITPAAPPPGPAACTALTNYMSHGGLLLIDTPGGDPGTASSGAGFLPGAQAALARDTACLSLPPLEALTQAGVLAHCFYILSNFPGRFTGPVQLAVPAARDADGVTPVIVTANDFAGAWASDSLGLPEQTPIPGGEAQRVLARRFGINLVIYALTGSYKADQIFAASDLDKLAR